MTIRKYRTIPSDYETRVRAFEDLGCTRSDAQGIVDAQDLVTAADLLRVMQVAAESLSKPQPIRHEDPIATKVCTACGSTHLADRSCGCFDNDCQ